MKISNTTKHQTNFIFVLGGVASGIGKGIATAVAGALLRCCDFNIRIKKLDPYLNVDPGTMNPLQHGEVFVTGDGLETDMDLGHYERFTGVQSTSDDNVTSGKIYATLLGNERSGEYLGSTVQIVPHLTGLIKKFILKNTENLDFALCEIGGTVGDCEALPFLEAIREFKQEIGKGRAMFIYVSPLPRLFEGELKTKPTQHAVRSLRSCGINPDVLLCRYDGDISNETIDKIAFTCGVPQSRIIPAANCDNIYLLPINYNNAGLSNAILDHFCIKTTPNLSKWVEIQNLIASKVGNIEIAVIGKYIGAPDAYCSLVEAIRHAALRLRINANVVIREAIDFEGSESEIALSSLKSYSGIIIAGGFGSRGINGKIATIKYARNNKIPLFGICLGAQLMCIEYASSILNLGSDVGSKEFGEYKHNIVVPLRECVSETTTWPFIVKIGNDSYPIRLGNYHCCILSNTKAMEAYQESSVIERHRHRYEINDKYSKQFEENGLHISGRAKMNDLIEIVEIKDHPWAVGVQFHPELLSSPINPHPLFLSFIKASIQLGDSCL